MGVSVGSSIYNAPSIYESGAGGGGSGVPYLKNIMPVTGVKVADENGYIGGDFLNTGSTYYNNFAIVIPGADYSEEGLGQVTFTDATATIGGRVYRVITIGGATWLAENLDYKFSGCEIGSSGSPTTPAAWYYNNNEAIYGIDGNRCGLLYNWHAVKLLNDNRDSLIPGWHVPTSAEWDALANAVGGTGVAGTILKAANVSWAPSWGGTDDYGFGVLPAGCRGSDSFYDLVSYASFWTITELSSTYAYLRYFDSGASLHSYSYDKTNYAFSVRLVKDT